MESDIQKVDFTTDPEGDNKEDLGEGEEVKEKYEFGDDDEGDQEGNGGNQGEEGDDEVEESIAKPLEESDGEQPLDFSKPSKAPAKPSEIGMFKVIHFSI